MKSILSLVAILALASVIGCTPPAESGDSNTTTAEVSTTSTMLCGSCGELAGSEGCCADSADSCECGMHKGSALCCKDVELADGENICTLCGVAASGEHTCDADAEKCESCGLAKGSAGCCKLGEAG